MITSTSWLAALRSFIHGSFILQWPIFINAACLPLVFASSFHSSVTSGLPGPRWPGGETVTACLQELVDINIKIQILERL